MNSLSALSFVLGAGVGAGIAFVIWLIFGRRREARRDKRYHVSESTVYFGRDVNDNDHPDDIERQGSLFATRDPAHRYDGVTKDEHGNSYLSSGLDFGKYPR